MAGIFGNKTVVQPRMLFEICRAMEPLTPASNNRQGGMSGMGKSCEPSLHLWAQNYFDFPCQYHPVACGWNPNKGRKTGMGEDGRHPNGRYNHFGTPCPDTMFRIQFRSALATVACEATKNLLSGAHSPLNKSTRVLGTVDCPDSASRRVSLVCC